MVPFNVNVPELYEYLSDLLLSHDSEVREKAEYLFAHTNRGNRRSKEQHQRNCYIGAAGEIVLFRTLKAQGHDVRWAPEGDFFYDITIDGTKTDIKVRSTAEKKWLEQTIAERNYFDLHKEIKDVLYMGIDCFDNQFVRRGECWVSDLFTTNYPSAGNYIPYSKLKRYF